MIELARGMIGQWRGGVRGKGKIGYEMVGWEREGEWSGGVRS